MMPLNNDQVMALFILISIVFFLGYYVGRDIERTRKKDES
jgi:hypothetical protein